MADLKGLMDSVGREIIAIALIGLAGYLFNMGDREAGLLVMGVISGTVATYFYAKGE